MRKAIEISREEVGIDRHCGGMKKAAYFFSG